MGIRPILNFNCQPLIPIHKKGKERKTLAFLPAPPFWHFPAKNLGSQKIVMGKRDKGKSSTFEIEENESGLSDSKPFVVLSSDDEEANEDLSLKIVEKALLVKAARLNGESGSGSDDREVVSVVDLGSTSSHGGSDVDGTSAGGEEANLDLKTKKVVRRKKKKTKTEKQVTITEDGDKAEMVEKVETVEESQMAKAAKTFESPDPNTDTVGMSDNIVLRKLLRGPRYFDPPDSSWETCYNCGEEGHMAVNCKSASKRKKPCYICGSLDHGARKCSKAQDCFICKRSGHRAKDCPEKQKSSSKHGKICLRCGGSGHDMFSCRKDYSHDDIKEMQCYVCKSFGHLCCVNSVDSIAREVSCYRCGQLGHTGLSCGRSHGETKETIDNRSPSICYKCGNAGHFARECTTAIESSSLCYKCGEGGHFARECTIGTASSRLCYKCGEGGHFARECSYAKTDFFSSKRVGKRRHESSTPNVRPRREDKEFLGYKSAPHDHGKSSKRKKFQFEENGFSTPPKAKQRGGWITEHPGDYSGKKFKRNHWNFPSTPPNEGCLDGRNKSPFPSGGRRSGSQSSKPKNSHIYSASRFSNWGNDEHRRIYNWW